MHVNHVIKGEIVSSQHLHLSYLVNLGSQLLPLSDADVNSPLVHEKARPAGRDDGSCYFPAEAKATKHEKRRPLAPRPSIATHATAAKLLSPRRDREAGDKR